MAQGLVCEVNTVQNNGASWGSVSRSCLCCLRSRGKSLVSQDLMLSII